MADPVPATSPWLTRDEAIAHVRSMGLDPKSTDHIIGALNEKRESALFHKKALNNVALDVRANVIQYPHWSGKHGQFEHATTVDALEAESWKYIDVDPIPKKIPSPEAPTPPVAEPAAAPKAAVKGTTMTLEQADKVLNGVDPKKVTAAVADVEKYGSFKKFAGGHAGKIGAAAAGVAALSLLIPNKTVTAEDGTETQKWGAGKKVAFFGGTSAVVLGAASKLTWGKKIELAAAQAVKTAGHAI